MPKGNTIEAEAAISAVVAELHEMHAKEEYVVRAKELLGKLASSELSPSQVITQVEAIRDEASSIREKSLKEAA